VLNFFHQLNIILKDDDEDGWGVRLQRVGGWCKPMAETSYTYHFRVETLKMDND